MWHSSDSHPGVRGREGTIVEYNTHGTRKYKGTHHSVVKGAIRYGCAGGFLCVQCLAHNMHVRLLANLLLRKHSELNMTSEKWTKYDLILAYAYTQLTFSWPHPCP